MQPEPIWNSLEIAKLIASILTPLTILLGGLWVNRRLKKFEHSQWANQRLIEKRIEVYDEIAPRLNDLLCYFTYIGRWKELNPPEVVTLKRDLDRVMYVNAPLFSEESRQLYEAFTELCFSTFNDWGEDAKLRTHVRRRQDAAGDDWKQDWNECFANEDAPKPTKIRSAYADLLSHLADELGVGAITEVPSSPIPVNYK